MIDGKARRTSPRSCDGSDKIRFRVAFRRLWGSVLAWIPFGLGYLGIVLSDRRRAFNDRVAHTEVRCLPLERATPWSATPTPGSSSRPEGR